MNRDARISIGLPNHPKTIRLERALGTDGPWCLVKLLLWTAQHRPEGDLSLLADEDLEMAVGWRGKSGSLMSALCACGFIDGGAQARKIHAWHEHNLWASGADERSAAATFAGLVRAHGKPNALKIMKKRIKRGAERTVSAALSGQLTLEPTDALAPSPSPSPYPSPSPSLKNKRKRAHEIAMPEGFEISERVRKWAAAKGHDRLDEHFENFVGQSRAKGYVYVDWDEALMNAIRKDWAQLRSKKNGSGNTQSRKLSSAEETEAGIARFKARHGSAAHDA